MGKRKPSYIGSDDPTTRSWGHMESEANKIDLGAPTGKGKKNLFSY